MISIIQGFLGAGKSTFSKQLALDTGAIRLNADEYCADNFTTEELEADWETCFSQAVTTLWRQAASLSAEDRDVILDIGFWSKASRDHARAEAAKIGTTFRHYYITAPDDVLKQRLLDRAHPMATRNLTQFDYLKTLFEEPAEDENPIIISTAITR